jgi:hypothetical protein
LSGFQEKNADRIFPEQMLPDHFQVTKLEGLKHKNRPSLENSLKMKGRNMALLANGGRFDALFWCFCVCRARFSNVT